MKLLTPEILESLIDRICNNCQCDIEYDTEEHKLYCPVCGFTCDYSNYKMCKAQYTQNPETYYAMYNYEKLSK